MGGKGVCFCCDCARPLWGESLALYLLLGTTCLLLLGTGSPHPNLNSSSFSGIKGRVGNPGNPGRAGPPFGPLVKATPPKHMNALLVLARQLRAIIVSSAVSELYVFDPSRLVKTRHAQ
ncbi:unnamed protein product [Pleuronectes platessa]|uniref:Uncharacterized protein n=1 Tax=Pleuronectes platessa TaxID=8262 RepID=A0A9N7Z1K8_PLEPL|nr:unnamed protein product [Pleuronectes platessa]